ncbi:DUF3817 domain-containing protein [Actinoplanes sp. G11-F43]|uniref:DUF3817 domain-containing protein n=1 Tax=Actinoplanes sp. G11-F43 TaxID=3424130 RepID=UPI003D34C4AA
MTGPQITTDEPAPAVHPVLPIAAWVELLSLVALLSNLATVHLPAITSLGGPVHGCAYLVVVILALRHPQTSTITRLSSLLPGIGGLLVLRRLRLSPTR